MLDRFITPHLDGFADKATQGGLSASKLTLIAFALGGVGCFAVGMMAYPIGLVLLLAGRVLAMMGASASKKEGAAPFATIIRVFYDFAIFAGFAFFFSLSAPETSMASAVLIFAFMAMGMAYLIHAWILARKNHAALPEGGIIENGEMMLFVILSCLYPAGYAAIAILFALLCWTTAGLRIMSAYKASKE